MFHTIKKTINSKPFHTKWFFETTQKIEINVLYRRNTIISDPNLIIWLWILQCSDFELKSSALIWLLTLIIYVRITEKNLIKHYNILELYWVKLKQMTPANFHCTDAHWPKLSRTDKTNIFHVGCATKSESFPTHNMNFKSQIHSCPQSGLYTYNLVC